LYLCALFFRCEKEDGISEKTTGKNMAIFGGARSPRSEKKRGVLCRTMKDYCG
jgi:hypothetical protein